MGAGGGAGSGGGGLLLYTVGDEGIEGGDELEHGLARGRRGLLGGLGGGCWLGWRGELPGRVLGDIGVCREIGFGGGWLDGRQEGLDVGVV